MRFGFLVTAAATAGVIATAAVPSVFLRSAPTAVQPFVGGFKVADLNPFRAVFNYDQAQITVGHTPESLGFKPSPVSIPSFPTQQPFPGLASNTGLQNGQAPGWQNPPH